MAEETAKHVIFDWLALSYDENPTCYGQVCPPGTSICRKNIKFALNKNNLDVRINCLDSSHQSVKEYHIEEEEFVHYDFAETNDHGPMNRGSYSTPYSYNGLSLPFFCILLVWWIFDLSLKLRH
ncbi:unnamed protein product [Callosobruchus maculatus]|uniref:Uncharacterized protein n=1 Tax=Callosobruchus maculatus TaxID=64391 RepID=A0A653BUS4_CALMS|nr:unnamed protein product [Callosobruchus maculatus]